MKGRIQAGALQFVLFIGAVVAVLLLSFLLLSYTHQHFAKQTDLLITVLRSADYGMESSLLEDFPQATSHKVLMDNEFPVEIKVQRDFWGVFEKRTVHASLGTTSYTKTALIGGRDKEELPALYLNDHQRPLVLAGNSKISGTAFLPSQGLKMGNIYGNSYNRTKLLYGKSRKSDSVLPRLDNDLDRQLKTLTADNYVPSGQLLTKLSSKKIKNSFEKESLIYKDRDVVLRNIALSGNIIIVADGKITVEASAKLHDILLLAPEIEFKNGFNGTVQAIATESIYVGRNCLLAYPSALAIHKKLSGNPGEAQNQLLSNQVPDIHLDSNSDVRGFVVFLEEDVAKKYHPRIKIETNATVTGEVYCSGDLELKGNVNGMVSTDGFIALENGNIYQNYLYNGTIDSGNLSPFYTGILMEYRKENKKVMKWLY